MQTKMLAKTLEDLFQNIVTLTYKENKALIFYI